MVSPVTRTETRLMGTRRNFFGAMVASSTTLVTGPWIAYANEEVPVADGAGEDKIKEESFLLAEESTEASADEPSIVEVVADESSMEAKNENVMEISNDEEPEEVTMEFDAKIQDSIESIDAVEVVAEPDEVAKTEETFDATVDKTKMFQELVDERRAIDSDEDMDAFRTKLQARIVADASFVQEFESFLDELTLASV